MNDLEKKLNKIYNYADLIHSENLLILSIIGSLLRESDKPEIEKCIKTYIQRRENIQKGVYEDDVEITQWYKQDVVFKIYFIYECNE